MRFSNPDLQSALAEWRRDPDVRQRAMAGNVAFEERVSAIRLAAFENHAGGAREALELSRAQVRYVRDFMEIDAGIPHTFDAALAPASLSDVGLDPRQRIVRLESLKRAFSYWRVPSPLEPLETLRVALEGNDTATVQGFLDVWNESNVRDFRPAFATWKDMVEAELAANDWADRLRDRLGLAHHDCSTGPIPIALMEYTVEEVTETAREIGTPHAVTAPTCLDTGPGPYFFPAPSSIPYGRVMSLTMDKDDDNLLAEMLHVRITYRRQHIARLGTISRPPADHELKELRNLHLLALRIASGRDDFGEELR